MVSQTASSVQRLPHTLGRYQVLGVLTSGGMGQILLGRLAGLAGFARPVIIKRILPELAADQKFVRMLIDEAKVVAQIHHSNVVHIIDLGQDEREVYLVMEYLAGESSADVQLRLGALGLRFSPVLAAHVVAEACTGLAVAHAKGIVHRDISPDNLFITYEGEVKILDFGVAKSNRRDTRTRTGQIKGKFSYMSPEQIAGEEVDARSDVFSLGIVLHELVTGRPLFRAPNPIAMAHILFERAIPTLRQVMPGAPPRLSEICAGALDRALATRTPSAKALAKELREFIKSVGSDPRDELRALMEELFATTAEAKSRHIDKLIADWEGRDLPLVNDEAMADTVAVAEPDLVPTPWARPADSGSWDESDSSAEITAPTPSTAEVESVTRLLASGATLPALARVPRPPAKTWGRSAVDTASPPRAASAAISLPVTSGAEVTPPAAAVPRHWYKQRWWGVALSLLIVGAAYFAMRTPAGSGENAGRESTVVDGGTLPLVAVFDAAPAAVTIADASVDASVLEADAGRAVSPVRKPPSPEMVVIPVTSRPPGATVTVVGGEARGPTTPTDVLAPRGKRVQVTLSLKEHFDEKVTRSASRGERIDVTLIRKTSAFPQ